jgi:hypothetical protein
VSLLFLVCSVFYKSVISAMGEHVSVVESNVSVEQSGPMCRADRLVVICEPTV